MKTNNEIVTNLLERRDQYETEKKNKRIRFTRTLTPICCVCLMALIGIGVWKGGMFQRQLPPIVNDGTQTDIKDTSAGESVPSSSEQPTNPNTSGNRQGTSEQPINPSTPDNRQDASEQPTNSSAPGNRQGTSEQNGNTNYFILFASTIEWNGVTYRDSDMANASAYTQDKFIVKVGDCKGQHEDTVHYRINSGDSIYTVKETSDVLFAVKEDGKIVVMVSPDWSLEKYEPERLKKGYIDPNTPADAPAATNDFCDTIYTTDDAGNVTYVNPTHADLADMILSSGENAFCHILFTSDNDGNITYIDPNRTDLVEKIMSAK